MKTRIYWDGELVDVPASSVNASVNTASVNDHILVQGLMAPIPCLGHWTNLE